MSSYAEMIGRPTQDSISEAEETPDQGAEVQAEGEAKAGSKAELLERAAELDIAGRSSMNKDELTAAIAEAEDAEDEDAEDES